MEIDGLQWMGGVHGGIVMDTLSCIYMTSTKNPCGWKWGFRTQCWVEHGRVL